MPAQSSVPSQFPTPPSLSSGRRPHKTAAPATLYRSNRSPLAVSQKREYFKYPPETIGEFTPAAANFGALRLITSDWEAGWRRSADRTGLQANSLLTGNFTGNFAIQGLESRFCRQEVP